MSRAAALWSDVRRRAVSPAAIMIATMALTNVLRIGNTMVLTRLLSPTAFGLAGIIFSVFFVVSLFTDAGFQAFVVRHERSGEAHFLDAIWTAHLLRGLCTTAVVVAVSWPVAWYVRKPALAPLLAAAAFNFAINGAVSPAIFTAVRTGLVRRLSAIDFGCFLAQVASGLVAALVLHSAWAMVISMLTLTFAHTVASYAALPGGRRRFVIDRAILGELWRFSRLIGASSWITLLLAQVDKLVLARRFSLPEFGVYSIGINLAGSPGQIVAMYTERIVYPGMVEAWRRDPTARRAAAYASRGLVFYFYLFGSGGLIGGGALLIRLLYDPRYLGAALYLRLAAIATAMVMLTRCMGECLVATGVTRTTLMMNVARVAWLATVGFAGLVWFGPRGLVVALSLIEFPAYAYGVVAMRRAGMHDGGRDLLAFAAIAAGAAAGLIVDRAARLVAL